MLRRLAPSNENHPARVLLALLVEYRLSEETRHQRLESLFFECLDLEPKARLALLEKHCGADSALRHEVLDLLERETNALPLPRIITPEGPEGKNGEPDTPGRSTKNDPDGGSEIEPPRVIGPYRLVQKLGEGGFGEVYEAEQTAPVRRHVAIKILKPGMDSRAILARFETERQALALMDHPGIAKVYDAGLTESGRSYFVMELVRGESIANYCDQQSLSLRDRLTLFIAVCRAVEHAHQKGVIHRDIKPSNILVTTADGKPHPRIIDFGIAKATGDPISGETIQTRLGDFLGTPEYMSPEQAISGGTDVDTRTDVYSLGVVLYRLVTRKHPFEPERLRRIGLVEVQRVLRDEDPPRPSDAAPLARELRGDVDWIVLKAMEKDRDRRYASAAALAEDIERHQRNEPVLAVAPSSVYRMRKLARRHRGLVLGSAVVLIALLVGLITTTTLFAGAAAVIVVLLSGLAATLTQAQRARRAEAEARSQAEIATAVNAFLTRMLVDANPEVNPRGPDVTLRDTVDRAARELEGRSAIPPRVEAGIRHALGSTYMGIGLYDEAERQTHRATELWRRTLGPLAKETVEGRLAVAKLLMLRGQYPKAESLLAALGVEIEKDTFLPLDVRARHLELHGENLLALNRLEQAESIFESVVAMREGAGSSELATGLIQLSRVYQARGRYAEAIAVGRKALAAMRQAHPGDHVDVSSAAGQLAGALEANKQLAESESLRHEEIAINTRLLGRNHRSTAVALGNLGTILTGLGRVDEGVACQREALENLTSALGSDSTVVATLKDVLAISLQTRGDLAEALELRMSSLETQRRVLGSQHSTVATSLNNLGALYRLMGRHHDALSVSVEAESIFRNVYGDEHPQVVATINNIGKAYLDLGRSRESEACFRDGLAMAVRILSPGHLTIGVLMGNRGLALAALGRYEEAEPCLIDAYQSISASLGPEHPRSRQLSSDITLFYDQWRRSDEAAKWRLR